MKSINVSDLRAGLRFDKPVYVDEQHLFVPENIEIKQRDIDRLLKWNVEVVQTDGKPLKELPSASKNALLQKAFSTPDQQAVIEAYGKIATEVQDIFERIRSGTAVKAVEVDDIVDPLLRLLDMRRNEVIQLVLYGLQGESGFIENSMNCAILASLIGRNLNMVQHRLIQLVTSSLLHDVGMIRVPASIRNKSGELTADELRAVQEHPVMSYRIITREMKFADEIGIAALQHQERWDGQGYPRQLSGRNINAMARVIAVVDAFEAMVSKRPYRGAMIGYAAMRAILSDNGRRFDPDVLKIFIRTMGIYPIGSIVLLKDGRVGRVIGINGSAPVRPHVKIMIDHNGKEFQRDEGEIVDLAQDKDLFIARAVDPKELNAHRTG